MQKALRHLASRRATALRSKPSQFRLHSSTSTSAAALQKSIVQDHALPPKDVQSQSPRSAGKPSVKDLFSLEGRTVVITGAGRGLGITLASAVLEAGGDAVCLDILPEPSQVEWASITKAGEETGRTATYHQCDITQEYEVEEAMSQVVGQAEKRNKPIRGLINCAGVQQMVDAIDYPTEGFKKILNINVTGSFLVAKHVARAIREAKGTGSIVFIASMSGQIANRVRFPVNAADINFAMNGSIFGHGMGYIWYQRFVVNSLSPGYIRTAMTDKLLEEKPDLEKQWMAGALLGRLGSVDDFKAPAIYLLTDGASFMTGDEGKPACAKCTSRGEDCRWDTNITFRLSGIGTDHPSMIQARNLNTPNGLQITQVTFDDGRVGSQDPRAYEEVPASVESATSPENQRDEDMQETESNCDVTLPENCLNPTNTTKTGPEGGSEPASNRDLRYNINNIQSSAQHCTSHDTRIITQIARNDGQTGTSCLQEDFGSTPLPSVTSAIDYIAELLPDVIHNHDNFGHFGSHDDPSGSRTQNLPSSSELASLDYLTSQANNMDFLASLSPQHNGWWQGSPNNVTGYLQAPFMGSTAQIDTPESLSPDNYIATYQDLHKTLYFHMVETARHNALTRQGTPDPSVEEHPLLVPGPSPSSFANNVPCESRERGLRLQNLTAGKLAHKRQFELWRNYLDEIAVWLDMFDDERHFQFKIPLLAKSADHLHYSILALSARHLERKLPSPSYTESLRLYQEAIQLIVKKLYTLDTTVIASCVLLCVLEMMCSSPKAWCRHLDGCSMLLEAAGINGVVGGVRESLFWCFARMDVWGGFLEDTLTKIPTSRWFIPSGTMTGAVAHFKAGNGSASYANYAVFLCASVVNVVSSRHGSVGQTKVESPSASTYSARWKALFNLLEDWYANRPEEMTPLMISPSDIHEPTQPFPAILYNCAPAVNGNQLYHAAAILMSQNKPKRDSIPRSPKSILWHAHQICGIAVSNKDHGARINSLQPLWIAGKLMSHKTEHRAILSLLSDMERDIGWATEWRANDLREYWGDEEDEEIY
ncbi:hypothetical protein VTL71DRAFT_9972 [Oculimacula yallundae]|uniref:Uncharacterized protein n=1 Tax=Oculimacula yallundae TaxID=86028 RepID=A0ABR4BRA0_9HELO